MEARISRIDPDPGVSAAPRPHVAPDHPAAGTLKHGTETHILGPAFGLRVTVASPDMLHRQIRGATGPSIAMCSFTSW